MDILSLIGAITGVVGVLVATLALPVSVLVVRRQEKIHVMEQAREQARNERSERLTFLSDRIFDQSIPRDLRLPFYKEYISMKGNGTAVKFWLMEGQKEQEKLTQR